MSFTEDSINKIILEVKSNYNPLNSILPSYMRNVNSILLAKDQISKISWEKEGQQIINDKKITLTTLDRKILKLLILKGVPSEKRSELWLISSGAKKEMKNNPGYYDFLINKYPTDLELPNDRQIDLDIRRTFPEDTFFNDERILKKLKNVLLAFSRRNISIGYVQGFNFIVGRLLKINSNEEEVFWIFTQILESILPLNFYSEMAGLMIDVDMLLLILGKYFPDLIFFLEQNYFLDYFKNILFQWFVTLFVNNFTYEASLLIWDMLLFEKNIILFKVVIGIVKYILKDLYKIDSLENFKNFIRETFNNFNDISYLKYYIILRKYEFNLDLLDKNRMILEYPIIDHINKINTHKLNKLREKLNQVKDDCYEEWPICIYDSESVYKVHTHFVLKCGINCFIIYEDYFFNSTYRNNKNNKNYHKESNFDNVCIERKIHLCIDSNRKRKHIISGGLCSILEQINDIDDSLNMSTGDKSLDISYDKSTETEDINKIKEISMSKNEKINIKSNHEMTKRNYKTFKKHTKFLSLISYSQFVKSHKEEQDFQQFISKLNNKYNKLAGKSFCLKTLEFETKSNFSNDVSFDL